MFWMQKTDTLVQWMLPGGYLSLLMKAMKADVSLSQSYLPTHRISWWITQSVSIYWSSKSYFQNTRFPQERPGAGKAFHIPCWAPVSSCCRVQVLHWYPQPCQHCTGSLYWAGRWAQLSWFPVLHFLPQLSLTVEESPVFWAIKLCKSYLY